MVLSMPRRLVSIIVVCWNQKHHLPTCLNSLRRQTYPDIEVIVVDNGCTDGTRQYVESEQPWVRVHTTGVNLGYAGANNAGFAVATGDYIVVLNPDTEVDPDFVCGLVDAVDEPEVGLATPRICFFDDRGVINACGNEVHLSGFGYCRGLGQPSERYAAPTRVASVSGCCFMIRRDVLDSIGGFDDDYFAYVEDTDLSVRAILAGYCILFVPRSIVYHKYALKMTPTKFFLLERNRRQTLVKNFRVGTLVALFPVTLMTNALLWAYALLHGPAYVGAKLGAQVWVYRNWAKLWDKRRRVQSLRRVPDREIVRLLSSTVPADQLVGPGLFPALAGPIMNLAYSLLAVPARLIG